MKVNRICKKCNKEKPISDFASNGKYLRHSCKQCEAKRIMEKIHITVAYIQSLKTECEICGYNKSKSALEFHHIDNSTKLFNIARFASGRVWSKKVKQLIDEEVKKCRCLCANCHREQHRNDISEEEMENIDFSFKHK